MTAQRAALWVALVALAVSAAMLHFRIHPPKDLTNLWPNLFSLIDLVLVSALFLFRRTALLCLLLNSFLAFLGMIMIGGLLDFRHPGGPDEGHARPELFRLAVAHHLFGYYDPSGRFSGGPGPLPGDFDGEVGRRPYAELRPLRITHPLSF
jgi:hypothetical protein